MDESSSSSNSDDDIACFNNSCEEIINNDEINELMDTAETGSAEYKALECDSCASIYCGGCCHLYFSQATMDSGAEEGQFICNACTKPCSAPTYQVCPGCYCPYLNESNKNAECLCVDKSTFVGDMTCYSCHCNYCDNGDRLHIGDTCYACREIHNGKTNMDTV